jgi:hypothetical protein
MDLKKKKVEPLCMKCRKPILMEGSNVISDDEQLEFFKRCLKFLNSEEWADETRQGGTNMRGHFGFLPRDKFNADLILNRLFEYLQKHGWNALGDWATVPDWTNKPAFEELDYEDYLNPKSITFVRQKDDLRKYMCQYVDMRDFRNINTLAISCTPFSERSSYYWY